MMNLVDTVVVIALLLVLGYLVLSMYDRIRKLRCNHVFVEIDTTKGEELIPRSDGTYEYYEMQVDFEECEICGQRRVEEGEEVYKGVVKLEKVDNGS